MRWFQRSLRAMGWNLQQELLLKTITLDCNGWGLKLRFHRMGVNVLTSAVSSFKQLVSDDGSLDVLDDTAVACELMRLPNCTRKVKQKVCGTMKMRHLWLAIVDSSLAAEHK